MRRLRTAVGYAISHIIDLDRLIAGSGRRYVLAYHRVIAHDQASADHTHKAMWVSPQTLESQIAWMRSVGEIVDYRHLLDFDRDNDRPLFSLTFDDGWRDNYEVAFPMLERLQVPALFFLVSAAVDSGELFWPEDVVTKTHQRAVSMPERRIVDVLKDLWPIDSSRRRPSGTAATEAEAWVEELKILPPQQRSDRIRAYYEAIGAEQQPLRGYLMTWDQARRMTAMGMSFGSHTHTHRILKGLASAQIQFEAEESRRIITDRLQVPIDTLCYPNARYNGREGEVLMRAGYRYAFRIDDRSVISTDDPFYIPRFLVSEALAVDANYFRLRLLEAPFFSGKPHDPGGEQGGERAQ